MYPGFSAKTRDFAILPLEGRHHLPVASGAVARVNARQRICDQVATVVNNPEWSHRYYSRSASPSYGRLPNSYQRRTYCGAQLFAMRGIVSGMYFQIKQCARDLAHPARRGFFLAAKRNVDRARKRLPPSSRPKTHARGDCQFSTPKDPPGEPPVDEGPPVTPVGMGGFSCVIIGDSR